MPRIKVNAKEIAEMLIKHPKIVDKLLKQERQLFDVLHNMTATVTDGTGINFGFLKFEEINAILNAIAMKK